MQVWEAIVLLALGYIIARFRIELAFFYFVADLPTTSSKVIYFKVKIYVINEY